MALFSITELARSQGVSRNHIRDLVSSGLKTHKGPGGQVLIDLDEYEDFVAELDDGSGDSNDSDDSNDEFDTDDEDE